MGKEKNDKGRTTTRRGRDVRLSGEGSNTGCHRKGEKDQR